MRICDQIELNFLKLAIQEIENDISYIYFFHVNISDTGRMMKNLADLQIRLAKVLISLIEFPQSPSASPRDNTCPNS